MLLIYLDEQALDDAERERCYHESAQLAHQLNAAGQYRAAAPLEPTSTATSVRVRDGKRVVTDGPFAETKEQLGGYFLIDARDLDEAIAIAARIPMARRGTRVPGAPVTAVLARAPRGAETVSFTPRARRHVRGGCSDVGWVFGGRAAVLQGSPHVGFPDGPAIFGIAPEGRSEFFYRL